MKHQTHALASGWLMRQEIPQVRPKVSGDRATKRGSFAADEIALNTAPTTFNGIPNANGHTTVLPSALPKLVHRISGHCICSLSGSGSRLLPP
jgi:hypothetical protein